MTQPLEELQTFFAGAIRAPLPVEEQPDARARVSHYVAGNARLAPAAQLEIYRDQFWMRHIDALYEDFATVHRLLGPDAFTTLVERYLEAHPPTDFSLRDLGAKLPAFIASVAPYRDDPLLADCARLEWAFIDSFDAEDAGPLDPSSLAAIPEDAWPGVRLAIHPSVQLVALSYPAHEYRAAVKAEEEPPRPEPAAACVVVYRGPEMLQYVPIERPAFELLERLARGETLGDACEAVAASGTVVAADLEEKVGGWFQHWTASGWIRAILR